jgi:hypothetical protein
MVRKRDDHVGRADAPGIGQTACRSQGQRDPEDLIRPKGNAMGAQQCDHTRTSQRERNDIAHAWALAAGSGLQRPRRRHAAEGFGQIADQRVA